MRTGRGLGKCSFEYPHAHLQQRNLIKGTSESILKEK
jgi:hypothetical protein